ncbi:MAG: DUF167 domain-containing protein [Syntrophorhabdales bacterium]
MNVEVKVITGAGKQQMRLDGSRLRVKLVARPVKGKANEELIAYIAETFGVKRRDVTILAGEKDSRKIVSIPVGEDDFDRILAESVP